MRRTNIEFLSELWSGENPSIHLHFQRIDSHLQERMTGVKKKSLWLSFKTGVVKLQKLKHLFEPSTQVQ